ncbi:MAG: thioredoxin domain-containing protein [archaeon]|nr:thioredoxin domain-containing protein [archaeon]
MAGGSLGSLRASSSSKFVIEATDSTFQNVLEKSHTTPLIVDFYADWCGPCRKLAPELVSRVDKADGKLLLVKVNTDNEERTAAKYEIRSLPTVISFWKGQPKDTMIGLGSPAQIDTFVSQAISHADDTSPKA